MKKGDTRQEVKIFSLSEQAVGRSIVVTSTISCASLIYLKIFIGTKTSDFHVAERKKITKSRCSGIFSFFRLPEELSCSSLSKLKLSVVVANYKFTCVSCVKASCRYSSAGVTTHRAAKTSSKLLPPSLAHVTPAQNNSTGTADQHMPSQLLVQLSANGRKQPFLAGSSPSRRVQLSVTPSRRCRHQRSKDQNFWRFSFFAHWASGAPERAPLATCRGPSSPLSRRCTCPAAVASRKQWRCPACRAGTP